MAVGGRVGKINKVRGRGDRKQDATAREQRVGGFVGVTVLDRYLEDAARGTVTVVTKHGKVIAKIVPADADPRTNMPFDFEAWLARGKAIRSRSKRGPETMHDLINEGRR